jgi:hypothetical protein
MLRSYTGTKDASVDASNNGSICLNTRVRLRLQVSASRVDWCRT